MAVMSQGVGSEVDLRWRLLTVALDQLCNCLYKSSSNDTVSLQPTS